MKFNFKKIAPILASAVLLGSTIGVASVAADLGSYPAPFVEGGLVDVAVVYGSDGMAIDMEAAALLTGDLASELAAQTAEAGGVGAVVGEGINLATHESLYFGDAINRRRKVLAKEQLPKLLADGTFTDGQGTEYKYTQSITLGSSIIKFGKSGESIDPILYIDVGSSRDVPLYTYKLSLTKSLNVSDSTYVQGKEIEMLGSKFTIGAGSTKDVLYLYGAGAQITLSENEEMTVTVAGKEYTIMLEMITSAEAARLVVDGIAQSSVAKGGTLKVGDLEIYVRDVAYSAKTGVLSYVDLNIGATKLKLESDGYVKVGADEDSLLGTKVTIAGAEGGIVSEVQVAQAAKESLGDYIGIGDSFVDRVFGSVKVEFSSVSPALDAAARDKVEVYATDIDAHAKFTTALSGKEYELGFAHDIDNEVDVDVVPILADLSNRTIHIQEGESATRDPAEYIVVNAGDKGRILQVTSVDVSGEKSKTVLTDIIDSTVKFEFVTGTSGQAYIVQDGQTYYINSTADETKITWGTGASYADTGGQGSGATTLFPRIKLKNGEWAVLLTETEVDEGTNYSLPGVEDLTTYEAASTGFNPLVVNDGAPGVTQYQAVGNLNWTIENVDNVSAKINALVSPSCVFDSATGPALLIIEEHKVGETDGDAVCVPLSTEGTSPAKVAIDTPKFSDSSASGFHALYTDLYKREAIDVYGTHVLYDTTDLNKVTVTYPDEQMVVNIILGAVAAEAVVTEPTEVQKLGDVVMSDTEAEASEPLTNLIVVGDAAVNKVAFELVKEEAAEAGLTYPVYGVGLTTLYGYGADQAIVKLFTSPYSATKKAMLVAGWEGPDTVAAAKQLIDKTSTLVGLDEKIIKKGVDYT